MSTKLYIGNLSFDTNDADLRNAFSGVGEVTDVIVMKDRETGRSRGFGFVTMSSAEEAQAAIKQFHGKEFDGRNLTVNEARPREEFGNSGGGNRGPRRDFGNGGGGDRRPQRRY